VGTGENLWVGGRGCPKMYPLRSWWGDGYRFI